MWTPGTNKYFSSNHLWARNMFPLKNMFCPDTSSLSVISWQHHLTRVEQNMKIRLRHQSVSLLTWTLSERVQWQLLDTIISPRKYYCFISLVWTLIHQRNFSVSKMTQVTWSCCDFLGKCNIKPRIPSCSWVGEKRSSLPDSFQTSGLTDLHWHTFPHSPPSLPASYSPLLCCDGDKETGKLTFHNVVSNIFKTF